MQVLKYYRSVTKGIWISISLLTVGELVMNLKKCVSAVLSMCQYLPVVLILGHTVKRDLYLDSVIC